MCFGNSTHPRLSLRGSLWTMRPPPTAACTSSRVRAPMHVSVLLLPLLPSLPPLPPLPLLPPLPPLLPLLPRLLLAPRLPQAHAASQRPSTPPPCWPQARTRRCSTALTRTMYGPTAPQPSAPTSAGYSRPTHSWLTRAGPNRSLSRPAGERERPHTKIPPSSSPTCTCARQWPPRHSTARW